MDQPYILGAKALSLSPRNVSILGTAPGFAANQRTQGMHSVLYILTNDMDKYLNIIEASFWPLTLGGPMCSLTSVPCYCLQTGQLGFFFFFVNSLSGARPCLYLSLFYLIALLHGQMKSWLQLGRQF